MTTVLIAGTAEQMAARVEHVGDVATIDCRGVHFKNVNEAVRAAVASGARTVRLLNVNGQRYIGTGLRADDVRIEVRGTPGQALAMFMDGPTIEVHGNAQDGVGNTMNNGRVVVHGSAGDVVGYGLRRGRIYIKGDVGYRAGIHMKADGGQGPVIVCGGKARDFLGEYMAGGLLVLLGITSRLDGPMAGSHLGAGMHGGEILIRGDVQPWQHGDEVRLLGVTGTDMHELIPVLADFCATFDMDLGQVLAAPFTRVVPAGHRPYAGLYTYV
jgi:glutamate synthase domain-containing protein 3